MFSYTTQCKGGSKMIRKIFLQFVLIFALVFMTGISSNTQQSYGECNDVYTSYVDLTQDNNDASNQEYMESYSDDTCEDACYDTYLECAETVQRCVNSCGGDLACLASCGAIGYMCNSNYENCLDLCE